MREILFKAKRVDNGRWIQGSLLLPTTNCKETKIVAWNGIIFKVHPETVCQFTGKEIKGVKLFEGDIFKVVNYFKLVSYNAERMAFSITNCDENGNISYSFEQPQNPSDYWWNEFKEDIKIIGNIHD